MTKRAIQSILTRRALLVVAFFAVMLMIPARVSPAAQAVKTYIMISHTGDDPVGTSLTYYFKEAISHSSRYTLESAPGSSKGAYFIAVEIVSLKTDDTNSASAMSVVADRYYYASSISVTMCHERTLHNVLLVGAFRAEQFGKGLLADIDEKAAP